MKIEQLKRTILFTLLCQHLVFDAVWALATALNKTAAMVQSGNVSETGCEGDTEGDLVPLQHFNKSISFISSSQHLNVGEGACVHTVPSTLSVSTPLGPVQSSSYNLQYGRNIGFKTQAMCQTSLLVRVLPFSV